MPNNRRRLQGTVIGNKMDKTAKVQIVTLTSHRLYRKVIKNFKTIYVHDENNELKMGDVVKVVESRPLSKLKRWVLEEVVEKADVPVPAVGEVDNDSN